VGPTRAGGVVIGATERPAVPYRLLLPFAVVVIRSYQSSSSAVIRVKKQLSPPESEVTDRHG